MEVLVNAKGTVMKEEVVLAGGRWPAWVAMNDCRYDSGSCSDPRYLCRLICLQVLAGRACLVVCCHWHKPGCSRSVVVSLIHIC